MTFKEFKPLVNKYTVKNLKKVQQQMLNFWGWRKLPNTIKHYKVLEEEQLVKIPNGLRGFMQFEDRYGDIGKVQHPPLYNKYKGNELDFMQDKIVEGLMQKEVGFGLVSTGVGKTSIIAKIIDKLQIKTLIIVVNISLLTQMKKDFKDFFGVDCRTLSGTKTKQKDCYENIVIANIDTIIKQPKEYLEQFDCCIVDEIDKCLAAERRLEFIGNITSKYIFSVSGTAKLNYVVDEVFPMYLGPKTEGILKHFTPVFYKVLTGFTYILDDIKEFWKLKEELYYCTPRNSLIVDTIVSTLKESKGICFCEYVEHAKIIQEKLEAKGIKTFLLIGEVKKDEREIIKQELKDYKGPCVLIGSVKIIGRGFDVPELSVGYLTTCDKFSSNIDQYCGRIIRKFPGKKDVRWYDFVDENCSTLYNQARSRTTTYKKTFPGCKILIY